MEEDHLRLVVEPIENDEDGAKSKRREEKWELSINLINWTKFIKKISSLIKFKIQQQNWK